MSGSMSGLLERGRIFFPRPRRSRRRGLRQAAAWTGQGNGAPAGPALRRKGAPHDAFGRAGEGYSSIVISPDGGRRAQRSAAAAATAAGASSAAAAGVTKCAAMKKATPRRARVRSFTRTMRISVPCVSFIDGIGPESPRRGTWMTQSRRNSPRRQERRLPRSTCAASVRSGRAQANHKTARGRS